MWTMSVFLLSVVLNWLPFSALAGKIFSELTTISESPIEDSEGKQPSNTRKLHQMPQIIVIALNCLQKPTDDDDDDDDDDK